MATYYWSDITTFLNEACDELSVGQIICREELSLQEAMSAVEILDPKMDSGANYRETFTMEERIEMGSLWSSENLNIDQCLAIMDQLLCCKMTWLSGYSLAQTVFTCLYLHNSYSIQNPWLSTYAKIVVKDCEVLRSSVMRADVYEEEDFNSHTFGMDMKNGVSDSALLNDLKQSEDNLVERIRFCKQKSKKSKDSETLEAPFGSPLCSDEIKELDYCEALIARIRLSRALYAVTIGFEKFSASSQCRGAETLKKSIVFALSQIDVLKKSREWLGDIQKAIPAGVFDPATAKILSHPSPTARIADILPWDKSLDRLTKLLQYSQSICEFAQDFVANKTTAPTFDYIQTFFERFNTWNCDIVARSRLTLVFCSNKKVFGLYDISEILRVHLETCYKMPPSVFSDISAEFMTLLATCVVQYFKLLCFNPARQRRKIHKQAGDWAELQRMASEVDSKISPSENEMNYQYLSCMMLDFVLSKMIYFLRLGFSLELYAAHEFPMIYWYLDYLRGMESQNLVYRAQMEGPKTSQIQQKKTKNKKPQPQNPTTNTVEQLILSAHSNMTRAIFRLIFAANSKLKINAHQSDFPLGSPELRFYHRFSLFHNFLQPAPLLYDHFVETTDVKMLSPEQLFEGAVESFKEARGFVERLLHNHSAKLTPEQSQQLQLLAKAAITNTVHIQLYTKTKKPKAHPSFDFSVNPEYPVVLWHS